MTLNEAVTILCEAGVPDALHDAREIFRHFGSFSEADLLLRRAESESESVTSAVSRRAQREPLQYILGEASFYREVYKVTPDCLIPRFDTEVLVDYAVKNLPIGAHFLDLCTGSGCIAISTLKSTENTTATGVDVSDGALAVAEENRGRLQVCNRLTLVKADVLEKKIDGEFFAVLSNPPYVTPDAYLALEREIFYEPELAFVGGTDGGDFYRRITELYRDSIPEEGFIAYEIGYDQAELLKEIAAKNGMNCEIISDLGSNPRVAVLRRIV